MQLRIIAIAYHRNGISAHPSTLYSLRTHGDRRQPQGRHLVRGARLFAVLDVSKLAAGDIAFMSNSWRWRSFRAPIAKRRSASRKCGTQRRWSVPFYNLKTATNRINNDKGKFT